MRFVIEPLMTDHVREGFECGEPAHNEFLERYARQNQDRGIGRTFVAVSEGERRVAGYYTIAAGSVAFVDIPEPMRKRLPRYPVPVAHLARLAVSHSMAGQGLGAALLVDALARTLMAADQLGIAAVEVRAKSESAKSFYSKFGFTSLLDDPLHMYLPLATVRRALK